MSHFSLNPTLLVTFYMFPKNVHYLGGAKVAYSKAPQILVQWWGNFIFIHIAAIFVACCPFGAFQMWLEHPSPRIAVSVHPIRFTLSNVHTTHPSNVSVLDPHPSKALVYQIDGGSIELEVGALRAPQLLVLLYLYCVEPTCWSILTVKCYMESLANIGCESVSFYLLSALGNREAST